MTHTIVYNVNRTATNRCHIFVSSIQHASKNLGIYADTDHRLIYEKRRLKKYCLYSLGLLCSVHVGSGCNVTRISVFKKDDVYFISYRLSYAFIINTLAFSSITWSSFASKHLSCKSRAERIPGCLPGGNTRTCRSIQKRTIRGSFPRFRGDCYSFSGMARHS